MLLKKLIKNLPSEKKNIQIKGLAANSKDIKKGFIFFAIRGNDTNGEKFINKAVKKGASIIICSKNCKYQSKKVLIIKTSNVRSIMSKIASKFYKFKPKNIIAVTGTNGKTSVADLFYQILKLNRVPVASIGTLGIKYKGKIIKSDLTTPNTIFLHKMLEKLKKDKIENVIIEASSHGLSQKRLDNLNLKAGIFTNFSQDHLDYHKTMKSYLNSKLYLFESILLKNKTIITDKLIKEFLIIKKIAKKRKLRLLDINLIKKKLAADNSFNYSDFQLKNLSMAIAAAKICNLNEKKIINSLSQIKDVNGRLELVKIFTNNVRVFVDFAHTPDALFKSIQALKKFYGENISVVFGCGGDRDKQKRSKMAKVVSENCKKIYVTDDNPRNERPEKIRQEIIKNIKNRIFSNIGNRKKAIKTAILNADPNEVILIAGKGHEDKQIYKNKILFLSDKQIIKKLNINTLKLSRKNLNYFENKKIIKTINNKIKIKDFHGLSIDTRNLKKNNLFVTIKGKNRDGAKFASYAIKKGARYIVSSRNIKKYKNKTIKVNNEIQFLNRFASQKRENTNAKIIAITGSAGKTSLKNLIKDLLKNYGETYGSPKSYNNQFGVPISLSQLELKHKFGVFEIGMSKPGEINFLSRIIRPHIGIITNIGEAHIENFKNLKGIANAKGEIINNIEERGTIILNRDDKFFKYLKDKAEIKKLKIISFGMRKNSDVFPLAISQNKQNVKLSINDQILNLKFKNLNIYNILASVALLRELNLDIKKITTYFKNYEPSDGRGKIHNIKRYNKNFKLVDESYNANPISVKNAVKNFVNIRKQKFKKYFLLGDMLELGKKSKKLHQDISKVINNSDIDKVFIKGSSTINTYKNIHKSKRGNIFQLDEDIDFTLKDIIANNDFLMIKGSNATGLNNISKKMIKGY